MKTSKTQLFTHLHSSHSPHISTPMPMHCYTSLPHWSSSLGYFNAMNASHAAPVLIHLKDLSIFPCVPQSPVAPKNLQGLKPLICCLLSNGFLKITHSLYNTILSVLKPDILYQLVQDIRAINNAVRTIHLVIPNSYTILSHVFLSTSHFSV